jgi:hypothetical protein
LEIITVRKYFFILLLVGIAARAFCQSDPNLKGGTSTPINVNKLLENSARPDLIGREMWSFSTVSRKGAYAHCPDTRSPEYGISQLPNAMWGFPQMGMTGRLCYGIETDLADPVKVQIVSHKQGKNLPLQFTPTRNEWTPAYMTTYYRALPDSMKGSYPYAGDLNVKERKCITEDNVLVLEYTFTHDNRTNGEYDVSLLFPKFKKLAGSGQYAFTAKSIPKFQDQPLPIEGFVAVENTEKTSEKLKLNLKPFESKTVRFTVAFDTYSVDNAIKKGKIQRVNSNPYAENTEKFNKWFADNVPQLTIDNYDMLKLYYYRWFLVYRNSHIPSKNIKNHPYAGSVVYEAPFAAGSVIGLTVPVHNNEIKWAKSPEMARDNILNWSKNEKLLSNYIQYTPKTIWDLYLHFPDKAFLDSVYRFTCKYTKRDINDKDKSSLPAQTSSWPTGAEYQPSFYEFTKDTKWDWRQDQEGKKLYGTSPTTIIRLDKVSFAIMNSQACSNIAQVLGNKTDENYFQDAASQMLNTVKNKHWDEKTGLFYDANPTDYALALESPGYDSFMPFMYQMVSEKNYLKSFEKFFDPSWFWTDYPITTVSKTCPMYWSGNTLVGPAYATVDKPHYYPCAWNGPTWHYANGLMCEALGSASLIDGTNEMQGKWMDFFNRWSDLHYAYGDKSVPCAIDHNRATDGARFSPYVDYFHSSWIDPFMKYYLGIQIDDSGNFNFNPFTKEEFDVNDISIMGKKCSFSQRIEGNSMVQTVFNSENKIVSKKTVKR